MGRNSGGVRNTTLRDGGRKPVGKSLSKVIRDAYLRQMDPLLSRSVTVNGNGHPMTVGFTKAGNKHLINDILKGKTALQYSDLPKMDETLSSAVFVKDSGLYKRRRDDITHFYYYKINIHGSDVYLHVAERVYKYRKGRIKKYRFLYAATNGI